MNCEFYPCPGGGYIANWQYSEQSSSSGGDESSTTDDNTADATNLSGWGSTPLTQVCLSDGLGNCGLCHGDCNSDADCKDGLMCFSRGSGEMTPVPGCISGGEDDKPGMDYCYSPSAPENIITTTAATTVAEEEEATESIWSGSIGDLTYARECTADDPCGACDGDCDEDDHCAVGLKCFSRPQGSLDFVPGCYGSGIAGMDYCYDATAPIVVPPTGSPIAEQRGCSAEIRACPDGSIVYQDAKNNCQFAPCPNKSPTTNTASSEPGPSPSPPTAPSLPVTLSPTFHAATFYCGYSMEEVNCGMPCPLGLDSECNGLETCIRGTNCWGHATQNVEIATSLNTESSDIISATTMDTPSELELCDNLCVDILPSEWCPESVDLPKCLEVGLGDLCESDGECATDDTLNNCGTHDVYARVVCGGSTLSQGQLMRATMSPTVGPSRSPIPLPTIVPSLSNRPTITQTQPIGICKLCEDARLKLSQPVHLYGSDMSCEEISGIFFNENILLGSDRCTNFRAQFVGQCCHPENAGDGYSTVGGTTDEATAASTNHTFVDATATADHASNATAIIETSGESSTPTSIADAITSSASNSATIESSQGPTSPPGFASTGPESSNYDRNPDGGKEMAASAAETATINQAADGPQVGVGSSEWYNSVYGDDQQSTEEQVGWDLDSYFTPSRNSGRAMRAKTSWASSVPAVMMGMWAATTMVLCLI